MKQFLRELKETPLIYLLAFIFGIVTCKLVYHLDLHLSMSVILMDIVNVVLCIIVFCILCKSYYNDDEIGSRG